MKTPQELFALGLPELALHLLVVVAINSLVGALILRFALNKAAGVRLTYIGAYLYNFSIAFVIVFSEAYMVYRVTQGTVLKAEDFISPGNWFAVMLSVSFAITVGTLALGVFVRDDKGRRIGTNRSFATALLYTVFFAPLALLGRMFYFWYLSQGTGGPL